MEFLLGIFFIPLVQSEFYQEIIKAWLEDQNPCTDVVRRSYSPPSAFLFNNPVHMPNAGIFCDFEIDPKIVTPPPSSISAMCDHFLTKM